MSKKATVMVIMGFIIVGVFAVEVIRIGHNIVINQIRMNSHLEKISLYVPHFVMQPNSVSGNQRLPKTNRPSHPGMPQAPAIPHPGMPQHPIVAPDSARPFD